MKGIHMKYLKRTQIYDFREGLAPETHTIFNFGMKKIQD
jgi:hypothetical protein